MRKLISRLSRFALLRRLVQLSRLHDLGNVVLRRRPLIKRLPGSGIVYRATSLESIPLGVEMFESGLTYDREFIRALPRIETFADLGCNVGYFTCLLAHLNPGRPLKGLMIDANAKVVEEARWHAKSNGLKDVHALHGIVGEPSPTGEAQFYVYASSICSSSEPTESQQNSLKGEWTKVKVPCVAVEKAWIENFGRLRCNLLKIDIEGSELKFLQTEQTFLDLVDVIILEWHKWRVQLPEIEAFLSGRSFKLIKIFEEDETMGTCCFSRVASP